MLNNLSIKDFAIIDDAQINFDSGLTVMTGETGAGKSIIIDALSLLIGERSYNSMIRKGERKAVIQGVFDYPKTDLTVFGLQQDDQLVIRREINLTGRNLISVNGVILTVKQLSEIGRQLVKISAQFDNQELLDNQLQGELVDRFSGNDLALKLADYQLKFTEYARLRSDLIKQEKDTKDRQSRLDFLQFEYKELSDLKLQPHEMDDLLEEDKRIRNFEKIYQLLKQVTGNLDDAQNATVLSLLDQAADNLKALKEIDSSYQEASETVESSYLNLQETARDLKAKLSELSFDEQEAQRVTDRISELKSAERKYHRNSDQLISYFNSIADEMKKLSDYDNHRHDERAQFELLRKELIELASKLHKIRMKTALLLEKQIHGNLNDLLLGEAIFKIHVTQTKKLAEKGFDEVDFWIQTNPGEASLPLNQIASGGEISRILLALTNVFSTVMSVPTIVFDEVDTGVSGRAAAAVARKMKAITSDRQVISISHLPQVASIADHQLQIEKTVIKGRTRTDIRQLDLPGRILSIANMLSGDKITEQAKANARELLAQKK
ncbi:DNA repair protein RecN [Oenococcus sicerae]|uniref:DNA repair protein RecN n=1 Tax=Oenococcus sicerae TaxID=2203724 RepID=A0AAJ1RDM0_9LACO|nr:DNA repair protein RecN [Oenococcus sicerae]MDN6900822.1 DNA repair protein RecN [Oenococcus sicerae]QAS69100.1 DNA repair protein RecN [Oenococcus sicerae]